MCGSVMMGVLVIMIVNAGETEARMMIPLMRWTWYVSKRCDAEALVLVTMAITMGQGIMSRMKKESDDEVRNDAKKKRRKRGYRELSSVIEWASKAQEVIFNMTRDRE